MKQFRTGLQIFYNRKDFVDILLQMVFLLSIFPPDLLT